MRGNPPQLKLLNEWILESIVSGNPYPVAVEEPYKARKLLTRNESGSKMTFI